MSRTILLAAMLVLTSVAALPSAAAEPCEGGGSDPIDRAQHCANVAIDEAQKVADEADDVVWAAYDAVWKLLEEFECC